MRNLDACCTTGRPTLERAAFCYNTQYDYVSRHYQSIGDMSVKCRHCLEQRNSLQKLWVCVAIAVRLFCCHCLRPQNLCCHFWQESTKVRQIFLRNLMRYNACFQITSFGASGECCKNKDWMSTFRVQGQVYHLAGSLLPYCIIFLAEYPRSGYSASLLYFAHKLDAQCINIKWRAWHQAAVAVAQAWEPAQG